MLRIVIWHILLEIEIFSDIFYLQQVLVLIFRLYATTGNPLTMPVSFVFWFCHCCHYVRKLSVSHLAIVRQLSDSRQEVVRQSSGSRQAIIRQLSGSHQVVVRQS